MALTTEDAKAAADVVGADMTVAADTGAVVALKSFRIFGLHRIMDLKPIKLLCFNPSRNLSTFFCSYIPLYVPRSCWSFNVE